MMLRSAIFGTGLLIAGAMAFAVPAQALTMKECGDKYQAAKSANTLNGMGWNDFRKAQCATEAAPAAATTPAAPAPAATAPAATTATKPAPAPAATTAAKPAPAATAAAAGMFPTAIDPEFANDAKNGKIKTCGKQWKALKAANQTNGMRWSGKGGYWSQCAAQLKAK